MKKIMLVAAIAMIAACSEPEAPAEDTATVDTAEPAAVMAADGQPPAGQYKVTTSDGKVYMEDLKEDGTYTSTDEDGNVQTGTWEQKSPDVYCYTEGEAEQICNTETVGDDGVWTSTNPEGKTAIVERVTA